jgi:hypothetical protein
LKGAQNAKINYKEVAPLRTATGRDNMNHTNVIDVASLQKLKSLSSLTSAQLERLATGMSIKKIRKKEKIFDEGESADMVYFLMSGIVRISWINH